ncbi:GNAT family N-acyltransferase [Ascidiaceihabitans sp.]|uniref:GNAT family N-acetyltransferase n=1 Tax=Ascidiaceihabitans sp. TaxID=1872644 RepID=UPI003296B9E2
MKPLHKGRYVAALASSQQDLNEAFDLRARCFGVKHPDVDRFDAGCAHILVRRDDVLVCCARMMPLRGGDILHSYTAQFYDLGALAKYPDKTMELGRFCIDPTLFDPNILRIVWGAITSYVDENRVKMLFGCSSFAGIQPAPYGDAFALLKSRYLGPDQWLPKAKAAHRCAFPDTSVQTINRSAALKQMPPLLRTYLVMGGWVSDHAVVDHDMNTLHVFTGVDVAAIPASRKRALRAVAG